MVPLIHVGMAHDNINCLEIVYSSRCVWLCGQRGAEAADAGGTFWCCQGSNYNKWWNWNLYDTFFV